MHRILCALLMAAIVGPALAAGPDFMTDTDGRKTVSLDGKWQIIVDPYENGFYDYRYQESPTGYFQNLQPKNKSDRVEYAFDAGHVLNVPGDWNTQDDKLFYYEGTVWYKKDFDDPRTNGGRLFLYFGAANYEAYVYLNGKKIGHHVGGFTPFQFEITDQVKPKGNFVVVKVDDTRRRDGVPTLNTDWWNYGGLTRPVKLIETPRTYVQDDFIQLAKGKKDHVSGMVQLAGDKLDQPVTIEIPEIQFKQAFQPDAQGRAAVEFDAKLDLWSPDHPKLYRVVVSAGEDTLEDKIGFRTIETRGTQILLNGEPIFLRGICMHEEAPLRPARAFSPEDDRTLLGWAKELNCNFVRLAHYPHNEAMLRAADEMGLLVWSETPVYWTVLFDNPETYANAENQLSEAIRRDKNRASVILWSVGNETPVGDARNAFLRKLVARVRTLDSTRLVTAALEKVYQGPSTIYIDDPLGADLDVLGCNEYLGWYDGAPEKCDGVDWKSKFEKPVVISEVGGGALQGMHGDAQTMWTEEYQKNLYEHQVAMFKRIPFLAGVSPWILKDFRSPRRPLYGVQDGFNRKGLISERGEKKAAFYVMQSFYADKMKANPESPAN